MIVPVKLLGSETILGSDPGRLSGPGETAMGSQIPTGQSAPQNKLGNSRGNVKGSLQGLLLLLVKGKPNLLLRPSFHAHHSESISPRANLTPFSVSENRKCSVVQDKDKSRWHQILASCDTCQLYDIFFHLISWNLHFLKSKMVIRNPISLGISCT